MKKQGAEEPAPCGGSPVEATGASRGAEEGYCFLYDSPLTPHLLHLLPLPAIMISTQYK